MSEQRIASSFLPRHPRRCLPLVGILAALSAPQAAHAHVRSGIVATEYRATVAPLRPLLHTAISVRIDDTDRAVRLTVAPGHSVTVLDRSGEPLLRVDSGRSVVWHDSRLRGLPARVDHAGWTVPIILDGARVQLEGDLRRVRAPSAGWWLAVAAVLGAVTMLVLRLRRPSALRTARAFAALAAAATIAVTVTFALSSSASAGSRFVALDLLVCAGVGIAVERDAAPWRRVGAAAGLGLLAVFVGLLRIPALSHGVVLSPLPATAARALVVLALCAGAGAIAAAAVASLRIAPLTSPTSSPS